VPAQVPHDPVDVGRERGACRIETACVGEQDHEHLLREVLGRVARAGHGPGEAEDSLLVAAVERGKGIEIAPGGVAQQGDVLGLGAAYRKQRAHVIDVRRQIVSGTVPGSDAACVAAVGNRGRDASAAGLRKVQRRSSTLGESRLMRVTCLLVAAMFIGVRVPSAGQVTSPADVQAPA
jgi:hypothetical protein